MADGRLRPAGDMEAAFEEAGVDLNAPVITSCGSGVSAAILSLALEEIGRPAKALYDGSWTEWGSNPDLPLETGEASAARNSRQASRMRGDRANEPARSSAGSWIGLRLEGRPGQPEGDDCLHQQDGANPVIDADG